MIYINYIQVYTECALTVYEQIVVSINNLDAVVLPCLVNLKNSNLDLFQLYTKHGLERCKELLYTNHYELNAD